MNKAVFILKAIYAPLNVKRYYNIRLGQNLFKEWEVYTSYGRMGTPGQAKLYTFSSREEALFKLKEVLHKRFTAKKRIGGSYSLQNISVEKNFKNELLKILKDNSEIKKGIK